MGRLDQQLAARVLRDHKMGLTIRSTDREEAAVIARRHGYELHLREVEEPGGVWAEFWPAAVAPDAPVPTCVTVTPVHGVTASQHMERSSD
jgi:hypothetical protein